MRWFIILAIIGLIACSSLSATASTNPDTSRNYIAQLEQQLNDFTTDDSILASLVTRVQARRPLYQQWIDDAQRLSRIRPGRLSVITQSHDAPGLNYQKELLMFYSQWRARQLLDSLDCHVVGVENIDLKRITEPALEEYFINGIRKELEPGNTIDSLTCQLMVIRAVGRMGALTYLISHPKAVVVGIDDDLLLELQTTTAWEIPRKIEADPEDSTYIDLYWAALRARSEIAAAKLIQAMAVNRRVSGALIIGRDHQPELKVILRRYGLRTTFYPTEPPAKLAPGWWK